MRVEHLSALFISIRNFRWNTETMQRGITENCLLIIIAIVISYGAKAQLIHRAVVVNSDKGLSQNSVYSICKDSKGFMWFGTGDGLNRYDGKEFRVFRNSARQKSSLNGFSLNYTMYEDNRQCLWFSTERDLVCFDRKTGIFQDITPFGFHGNKYIVTIDTAENSIWFIQAGKGLFSYDYVKKVFRSFDFLFENKAVNLFSDSHAADDGKGNIWLTAHDGLYRFNKKTLVWSQTISEKNFLELCMDQRGMLWLLNNDSLFVFNPVANHLSAVESSNQQPKSYYSITSDDNNHVWIGTLAGDVYCGNSLNKKVSLAGNVPSLTGYENVKELRCIYYDKSGLLWVGTEGGGIIKLDLDHNNFNKFPTPQSPITSMYVKSLHCDGDSMIWIGTFKKWIYLFNPYSREITHLPVPKNKYFSKPNGVVYSITEDHEGIIWIGYDNMLIAYNKLLQKYFFHPVASGKPIINQIRVEHDELVLATTDGVFKVVKSNDGSSVRFRNTLEMAASETLLTHDGSRWASSLYNGIMKYNSSGSTFEAVAASTGIRCILEDTVHNIIWAASQSGLLAYHEPTGKSRFYDEADGLISTYLYGIVNTDKEIWVSTNSGLAKGTINYKAGSVFPDIHFKCYTKEVGLQSDEFNTGAYCSMPDGTILFGGINGLNWFRPDRITPNTNKPTVTITGLKVSDSVYDGTPAAEFLHQIKADFKNNTILIKFIGMEFHNPDGIRYRFRLDGLDNKWTEEESTREVRYANLSPGNYTFRLYAINADGVLSDETSLRIDILPPFYRTWWFITMTITVLLALIVLITKYVSQIKLRNRIRLLEKEKAIEEERHRISKEMHDDLGAGLTQISLISEAARRRNGNGNFPRKELDDIADTSRQLIENVSEIIWAMNPDFDSLSGMIAYLREQISKLLEYSDKKFLLKVPESYEDCRLSNVSRKNIIMMVKEAVNNAIKHSKGTEIEVEISLPEDRLCIGICDNGQGFVVSQDYTGNGLKNYRYRAGLLGGSADIYSDNSGTRVFFDIPLKR